jgi:hypothetical protein
MYQTLTNCGCFFSVLRNNVTLDSYRNGLYLQLAQRYAESGKNMWIALKLMVPMICDMGDIMWQCPIPDLKLCIV